MPHARTKGAFTACMLLLGSEDPILTEVESEITCLLCKGLYLEQLHLPGIAPSFSTGD